MRKKSLPRPEVPNVNHQFLKISEVAELVRASVSTVRRRIGAGELTAIDDARLLVPVSEVYDYLERRRRRSKRRPILGDLVHPSADQPQVIDPSNKDKPE